MDVASFLTDIEGFDSLGREAAQRLVGHVVEVSFEKGSHILKKGDPGDCMYVLISGRVEIPIYEPDGREKLVVRLGPRQMFGEMALLTGESRTADVFAASNCRCIKLYRDVVEELIADHPEVAQLLTAILGERLLRSGHIRQIGKYKLTGELGRGSMSIVYEGIHPELERTVAVKMLSHELVCRTNFRDHFRNEAKIISRLRHPHIVEVFDTEQAYATLFIVMERLHGIPLDEWIESRGPLEADAARDILRQVASALAAAHRQGIVHRDVKPSNIMISRDGLVKLTDFGLALDLHGASSDQIAQPFSGTPAYMAPEQIDGAEIDARTDIYSLGIMAYELITGRQPFTGPIHRVLQAHREEPVPPLSVSRVGLPTDLEEVVRRATAKDPRARFASCDEIHQLLSGDASSVGLSTRTLTFVYDPRRESEVERLIETCREAAEGLDGVDVS